MLRLIAEWLIERALSTPYFHLHHADGSLYMERYWLVPFVTSGRAASDKDAGCYVATWRQPLTWLLQRLGIAVRVHCIHTADLDRALHDHPWTFLSVVLRGWYVENRPSTPNNAVFEEVAVPIELPIYRSLPIEAIYRIVNPPVTMVMQEPVDEAQRRAGSIAVRRFYHRHRIIAVSPGGVWTLFVTFRKRQSWGFFTPQGKVWWWAYESVHNKTPIA